MPATLLPRARLRDILGGKARLVGARCDARQIRGVLSPVEARLRMGIPYEDLKSVETAYLSHRSMSRDLGVIARTLLACALSPSTRAHAPQRPFIVSARVDNLSIEDAVEAIFAPPARLVHFVHAHALTVARFDRRLAAILARADVLLPDGIGIRLAASALGIAMRHNLNGADLFPRLCERAARDRIPLVLVGGAPGVAAECARRMIAATPGLEVPVVSDGFFADELAVGDLVDRIRTVGRALVLVGMGSPRQENWTWRYLRNCAGATVLTVGGLFDFYSGRVRRAPILWRETGMEWAYRILQEPRRLAKRYLIGNPLFLALEQRLRRRSPPAR